MIDGNQSSKTRHRGVDFGTIPWDWEIVPIRRICTLNTGATPDRNQSAYWHGTVNWFSAKDLKSERLAKSEERITTLAVEECGLNVYRPNSLVACFRSGILRHTFPVAVATEPFCVNQDLRAIRVSATSPTFFQYYLSGVNNAILASCRKIGATVESIETKWFLDFPALIPPADEQDRIVRCLDAKTAEIDGLIEKLARQVELLERYRRELIARTVTRGLDPDVPMKDSGIEWIGEVPTTWRLLRIAALYDLRSQKVSDKDYPPLSITINGVVPQLETVAKTNDGDNRKLVKAGDFIINSRSDRRGACGISPQDGSCSLINIVLSPQHSINNRYFSYLFRSPLFADEFYRWGHGIHDDLWTTNWSDMKSIQVPVPPLEAQETIARYLDSKMAQIDATVAGINKQIELLGKYRKQVINDLVTGKVRVGEVE